MTEPVVSFSTRHSQVRTDDDGPHPKPRLGRRESEPHSDEINYLYDILSTNFPKDRTLWDLHHYFIIDGEKIDIQFDISYFKEFELPFRISSYDAQKYGGRVPTMAINILSKSTFKNDLGIVLEQCQRLQIPVYVMLSDHLQTPSYVKAPMLKIYYLEGNQYHTAETREICCKEGEVPDPSKLIDILPDILPFKFGIMERKEKYLKNTVSPLYFLALVDRDTGKLLLTSRQQAEEMVAQEKRRADEEKRRADEEKRRADKAEMKAEQLQKELERLKHRD